MMEEEPAQQCPSSGTAEEKDESALSPPPSVSPTLSPLSVLLHFISDLWCSAELHTEVDCLQLFAPQNRRGQAGRNCCIIQPRQEVDGCFFIMLKFLFVYGVLGVMLMPVKSEGITVCVEEDDELRVDCQIEPKPNRINSYEFALSIGNRQLIINTNVSGGSAEEQFKGSSRVEELEPHGYRMTMTNFRDKVSDNTIFLCKISGQSDSVSVQNDGLATCSAVSLLLKSSWSWMVCLLLFFYHTHS